MIYDFSGQYAADTFTELKDFLSANNIPHSCIREKDGVKYANITNRQVRHRIASQVKVVDSYEEFQAIAMIMTHSEERSSQ